MRTKKEKPGYSLSSLLFPLFSPGIPVLPVLYIRKLKPIAGFLLLRYTIARKNTNTNNISVFLSFFIDSWTRLLVFPAQFLVVKRF